MVVAKINLIFIISSIFLSIYNIYIQNDCQYPIDNPINLNECYLIVHNLISDKNNSVKTYVSSYTKRFLIELLSNATEDCFCCPI